MQRKEVKKLVMGLVESIAALYEEKDDEKKTATADTAADTGTDDAQSYEVADDKEKSDTKEESKDSEKCDEAAAGKTFYVQCDPTYFHEERCKLQADLADILKKHGYEETPESSKEVADFVNSHGGKNCTGLRVGGELESIFLTFTSEADAYDFAEKLADDGSSYAEDWVGDAFSAGFDEDESIDEAKKPNQVWFVYLNEVDSGTGDAIEALSDIISKYNYEIADGIEDDVYDWIEQYIKDDNALQHFIGVTADPDQYPAIMFDDESAAYAVAEVVADESNTVVDDWVGTKYP